MPGCNCPGQSCGCAVQAGPGVVVQGTGSASSPFVVQLDTRAVTIDQTSAGVLDLSSYVGDVAVTVNLQANVTGIILPNAPGTRLEIMFVLVTPGRTVTFPPEIRVTGGLIGPTAVGAASWVQLRQFAGAWVGILLGMNL